MRNLSLIFFIVLATTYAYAQDGKRFINKQNSLEAGLGFGLFSGEENTNFYRLQICSRDLSFKRLGVYYTLEFSANSSSPNYDLIGLSCRLHDNFSVQTAAGFLSKGSIFNEKSFRKEISFVYHPIKSPLTYTLGFSKTFGPTLNVNLILFRNDKT